MRRALWIAVLLLCSPALATTTEEVSIPSEDGVHLAGTLYLPSTPPPWGAVVLIHGSGPQKRGWPYVIHAQDFAGRGVATLIYDKRGVGGSGGRQNDDFARLAGDAAAAYEFLARDVRIRRDRIGLWGRSQGAWIAPIAARLTKRRPAFVVLVVGGGVSVSEQIDYNDGNRLRRAGFDQSTIAEILRTSRLVRDYYTTERGEAETRAAMEKLLARSDFDRISIETIRRSKELPTPAFIRENRERIPRFVDFDPATDARALRSPVLAIFGSEDNITPTEASVARLRKFVRPKLLTVDIVRGVDHVLCPPTPNGELRTPCELDREYTERMGAWIARRGGVD